MSAWCATISVGVLGLTTSLICGCASQMTNAERASMMKEQQHLAFGPLAKVMEEGGPRRVLLEMGPWDPPERMVVVESEDPEVLRLVSEGLRTAERPVEVRGMIVGLAGQGRVVLYSKTLCADIWLTELGFSVGSSSPADYTCFVSPGLAAALGGLYFRKTGLHMDELLLSGLSERSSDWFAPEAIQGWERISRPRE